MQGRERSYRDRVFRRAVIGSAGFLRRALIEPIVRWERRRATIRALSSLDDRMLADIGISRNEIDQMVLGRLPRRGDCARAPSPPRPEAAREMRRAA
jgi:uncharacterized protein YjiS (DUF1127 family)